MKKIKTLACLCFAAVLLFAGCADDKSNNTSENDTSGSLLSEETVSGDEDSSADISAPSGTASGTAPSNNPGTASNVTASSAQIKQDHCPAQKRPASDCDTQAGDAHDDGKGPVEQQENRERAPGPEGVDQAQKQASQARSEKPADPPRGELQKSGCDRKQQVVQQQVLEKQHIYVQHIIHSPPSFCPSL